jgi:hypothetical protein
VDIAGSTVTFTPEDNWYGIDYVTFTATDGEFNVDSNLVVLQVTPENDVPVLQVPDQTMEEDGVLTLELLDYSSDDDGDTLVFSVVSSAADTPCNVNDTTLTVTTAEHFSGTGSCMLEVTDGFDAVQDSFDIEVTEVNLAPEQADSIGILSWDEDTSHSITLGDYFTDPDGDELSYSSTEPENITVSILDDTAYMTPLDDWFGLAFVTFTASDGLLSTDSDSVVLEVRPVNDPPEIVSSPSTAATEEVLYEYQVVVNDVDSLLISYGLLEFPGGMTIDDTGLIEWVPGNPQAGSHTVTLEVSDGELTAMQSYDVSVDNTNDAPEFEGSIDDQEWPEDTEHILDLSDYFSDADGDPLEYGHSDLDHITVEFDGAVATLIPEEDWHGTETVRFFAADPSHATAESNDVELTVTPENDAPVLDPFGDIWGTEGELMTIVHVATDADGDELHYSFGWPFDEDGEWTPGFTDSGVYEVEVVVTDGILNDTGTVTVHVSDSDNHAPELDHIDDIEVYEGQLVDINPGASDPDWDKLSFSFTAPLDDEGMWEPDFTDAGVYLISVTVSDGQAMDSQQVTITVLDTDNHHPHLDAIPNKRVREGEEVIIEPTGSDPDGDELFFTIGEPVGDDGRWQTGPGDEGEYLVTVTVSDGMLTDSQEVLVTVREAAYEELFVQTIRLSDEILRPGETLRVFTVVMNTGNEDMEGVKITATVPELGLRSRIGTFSLDEGDEQAVTLLLHLPYDVREGWYTLRVTYNNANERRNIHREFYVR